MFWYNNFNINNLKSQGDFVIFAKGNKKMKKAINELGLVDIHNPLLRIVTLSLPVVPYVKITDLALKNSSAKMIPENCVIVAMYGATIGKIAIVGKELTTSLFYEMLNGIAYTSKIKTIEKMDKTIPIILLSGEEDPVGDMTKGITKYYNVLKKLGYNTELKLYPNPRHDLLNEESKEKIYKDISQYIEKESIN